MVDGPTADRPQPQIVEPANQRPVEPRPLTGLLHRLSQARETRYSRGERRRLLEEAPSVGVKNVEMLGLILDGYYDARQWPLDRFGIKGPQLAFDGYEIFLQKGSLAGVLPGGKVILLSPEALRGWQEKIAQSGNITAGPDPRIPVETSPPKRSPPSLYQVGQEVAVEEITHCAQFQGATDRVTGEKLGPIETNLKVIDDGLDEYNSQSHELEAWEYKWLYYEDQVRQGKLPSNPLTQQVTSLGIDTKQLR